MSTKRKSFGKIKANWEKEIPHLLEIQKKSFEWFLNEGIQKSMEETFPILSDNEKVKLECLNIKIDEPKGNIEDAIKYSSTYDAAIRCDFKVTVEDKDTGEIIEQEPIKDMYFGDIPYMTESGSFIVNGAERVIVSQIVRCPGAYSEIDENIKNGRLAYMSKIMPSRGAWVEYMTESKSLDKDVINMKIDKSQKILGTVFLSALDVPVDFMEGLFGANTYYRNTVAKMMDGYEKLVTSKNAGDYTLQKHCLLNTLKRMKPGEPETEKGARQLLGNKFFNKRRYNLTDAGRFKINQKLSVTERLHRRVISEPILDNAGKVLFKKDTLMSGKIINELKDLLKQEKVALLEIPHDRDLLEQFDQPSYNKVVQVSVYKDKSNPELGSVHIVGINDAYTTPDINIADIFSSFAYNLNFSDGVGSQDDIDHLGNRRVRHIGELLQNQFNIGLTRMIKNIKEKMVTVDQTKVTPKTLIMTKPLVSALKEFFNSSQLSQFMDQTNPLSSLTNKRRLSVFGPGGIRRGANVFGVRNIHFSHYGRICPIETPEGPNIGFITTLATFGQINELGFITTPYIVVKDGKVTDKVERLTAFEEQTKIIVDSNTELKEDGAIKSKEVFARYNGENIQVATKEVHYMELSPKQVISASTSMIPFLENDDANRALMGANMQRQAVPLQIPGSAYVGTGMEEVIAKDSGVCVLAKEAGEVTYVDSTKITIKSKDGLEDYELKKYTRTNQGTAADHRPIVSVGQKVKANEVIADGISVDKGEIALGQNVTVAFMTWNGFNYEDAIIMSERLVKDDTFTSLHIEQYKIERATTKLGPEEITRDIPNTSDSARKYLDEEGVIQIGTEVKEGDILVGKVSPKSQEKQTPEDRLLEAIFGEKSRKIKDSSLRVPHGADGVVLDIQRIKRSDGVDLPNDVEEIIKVFIIQKRKISEGDKMAGRHGNKGVISRILPMCDMPRLEDGTPVDIMLNPLGVPSRMNIGQVLEVHLGMAAKALGMKVATPVFDGATEKEVYAMMKDAKMAPDGKYTLYDGITGERFDNKVTVGVMHMIKLAHMVDDKLHARSVGPYSLITQQPLGGKAQKGGQRFGEMEVWALEGYGAANLLQEMLTLKSDDMEGRSKLYEAILKGKPMPKPSIPESFNVLSKELNGLGIDIQLLDEDDQRLM